MNLPGLREELSIASGPRLHDGQPSWTLHDPSRNRYFRLDWLTFEILQRWYLGDPKVIADVTSAQTTLKPNAEDVLAVFNFAGVNQLLRIAGPDTSSALAESLQRQSSSWWKWCLHNYLFFRVPLVRPEKLLGKLHAWLGFLFRRTFWYVSAAALCVGAFLMWKQWADVQSAWHHLAGVSAMAWSLALLIGVKVVHELGHGLAAHHFGCRVPSMGMAFLVMTPVAYTDTNEAWKLKDRRPRLIIGAAGMLAELLLAAWSTLAWTLLPDGHTRTAVFMLATVTWVKSLLVNTSPLMRFDGYYLLSDWLDLPNLHGRVFALARWRLREWLFGLGAAPPEHFRRPVSHGLTALAFVIWIYRLVVFFGIAVFVYHYFFKALGILLFAVEIAWFIALPIAAEFKAWSKQAATIKRSRRLPCLFCALAALLACAVVPLPRKVRVDGQLQPELEYSIETPEAGELVELHLRDGERIEVGQPVARLESPSLHARYAKAQARRRALSDEYEGMASSSTSSSRARAEVLKEELAIANATCRELEAAVRQLAPTAPVAGIARIADCDLRVGEQLGRHERVATIVPDGEWQVFAYVDEQDIHLVRENASARIYLSGMSQPVRLQVSRIDRDVTRIVKHPLLTTPAGGNVSGEWIDNDWVPSRAVYRVTLSAPEIPARIGAQIRRGTVAIDADAESLCARWSRSALSVMWREFGF